MKMNRFTPVAALGALALVLTACSSGGGSTPTSSGSAGGGETSAAAAGTCAPTDLETLSIMAPYFSTTAPSAGDPIGEKLSELAEATLDMRWVPNANYGDQTNVVLAGDDIPNVMVIQNKTQGFIQTAEAGGFWDLTPYLASGQFPNLETENPEAQEAASVNGTVFGVYRARDIIRHGLIIRADWLANLGLEAPTTTEEFKEVLRAFTEDDPDGNGQDDTYGLIVPNFGPNVGIGSPWDAIELWYGAGNVWRDDDGELTSSWTTDEWREALKFERDLVESGYVNPDFATMDPTTWNEAFINGKGGVIIDVQSRAPQILGLLEQADPATAANYLQLDGQIEGPNGRFALPTAGFAGFLAVPRSAEISTEEDLCAVLTALNELNTKEAQILMNNGIEGDNFTVEDGFAVKNPDRQDVTDLATGAWAQLGMNVAGYEAYSWQPASQFGADLEQRRLDLQAVDREFAVFNPAAGLVSPTFVTNQTQLNTLIADARIQYLAGQLDDAGLDAVIERWKTSGGDTVATEFNELFSATE